MGQRVPEEHRSLPFALEIQRDVRGSVLVVENHGRIVDEGSRGELAGVYRGGIVQGFEGAPRHDVALRGADELVGLFEFGAADESLHIARVVLKADERPFHRILLRHLLQARVGAVGRRLQVAQIEQEGRRVDHRIHFRHVLGERLGF